MLERVFQNGTTLDQAKTLFGITDDQADAIDIDTIYTKNKHARSGNDEMVIAKLDEAIAEGSSCYHAGNQVLQQLGHVAEDPNQGFVGPLVERQVYYCYLKYVIFWNVIQM